MRYEITITHQPGSGLPDVPWVAEMFGADDDGKTGDLLASGWGTDPRDALACLLDDAAGYADIPEFNGLED